MAWKGTLQLFASLAKTWLVIRQRSMLEAFSLPSDNNAYVGEGAGDTDVGRAGEGHATAVRSDREEA